MRIYQFLLLRIIIVIVFVFCNQTAKSQSEKDEKGINYFNSDNGEVAEPPIWYTTPASVKMWKYGIWRWKVLNF